MKVEKKAVRSGILKLEKNVQITLDEDMNVPDTRPDVEKIIESRGEVHIDEIEVLTDRLRLRGNFLVQILYLSTDPEQQISCMEHDFAIEEFMNVEGAESSDIAKVTADLEDLTISIINSRKCGVRSVIYFHIAISEMKFVECTTGIEKKENVQCLYESANQSNGQPPGRQAKYSGNSVEFDSASRCRYPNVRKQTRDSGKCFSLCSVSGRRRKRTSTVL